MTNVAKQHESCNNTLAEPIAHQQASPAKGELVELANHQIDTVQALEAEMLAMPQVECPITHHFGGGVYIREGFFPAGTYALGHAHKNQTMNILLKGKMAVIVDGFPRVIEAPAIFTSEPGRKFAYAIEDSVLQNIHPTDSTDLDEIEAEFIDKSDTWKSSQIDMENASAIDAAVGKYLRGSN